MRARGGGNLDTSTWMLIGQQFSRLDVDRAVLRRVGARVRASHGIPLTFKLVVTEFSLNQADVGQSS